MCFANIYIKFPLYGLSQINWTSERGVFLQFSGLGGHCTAVQLLEKHAVGCSALNHAAQHQGRCRQNGGCEREEFTNWARFLVPGDRFSLGRAGVFLSGFMMERSGILVQAIRSEGNIQFWSWSREHECKILRAAGACRGCSPLLSQYKVVIREW